MPTYAAHTAQAIEGKPTRELYEVSDPHNWGRESRPIQRRLDLEAESAEHFAELNNSQQVTAENLIKPETFASAERDPMGPQPTARPVQLPTQKPADDTGRRAWFWYPGYAERLERERAAAGD